MMSNMTLNARILKECQTSTGTYLYFSVGYCVIFEELEYLKCGFIRLAIE